MDPSGHLRVNKPKHKTCVTVHIVRPIHTTRAFAVLQQITNSSLVAGNMALKDHQVAMRWVRAYISFFGGDTNRITLFGQGEGAANIMMLVAMMAGRYNFQRVILQVSFVGSALGVGRVQGGVLPDGAGVCFLHPACQGGDVVFCRRITSTSSVLLRWVRCLGSSDATRELSRNFLKQVFLRAEHAEHLRLLPNGQ